MSVPPPRRAARNGFFEGVPSKVRGLIWISAPISIASGFFFIVVSSYLLLVGIDAAIIGTILGVSGVSMVLSAIPLGLFSDRRGRKALLLFGASTFPIVLFVFAWTTEPLLLVLAGLLSGVAEAAFLSTWNALIADATPLPSRNSAFAYSFVVGTTASGIGFASPFFFPYLAAWTGLSIFAVHRTFLVLFGLLAVATPVVFRLFLWDFPETRRLPRSRWRATGLRLLLWDAVRVARPTAGASRTDALRALVAHVLGMLRSKGRTERGRSMRLLLTFSTINGVIGLGAGLIIPLIPTWLSLRFGEGDAFSGPLLAISSLIMGLAAFASAGLAKRRGPVRAIVTTQGLSTVFMMSLAFVPDPYTAGAVYTIRAVLMNMGSPIMDSYLMSIILPDDRGFASAINSIVWRLPNSVSTVVGGVLLNAGQYQLPFFLAATLYAVSILSFYTAFRNVRPQA